MEDETILTVMLHDVSERKRAEADLITAKEQAEQALIQAEKMAAIGTSIPKGDGSGAAWSSPSPARSVIVESSVPARSRGRTPSG